MTETCIRCRREVDVESDEFSQGEATADGGYICGGCLTGAEEQALDEEVMLLMDTAPLEDDSDPRSDPL